MSLCCVPTCKAKKVKGGEHSFHEFPSDLVLRQKWINIIFRNTPLDKVYRLSASSKVCSQHFTPDSYELYPKKKRLKSGAIPTIFEGMSEVYVHEQDLLPLEKMTPDYKLCLQYQQQKNGKWFPDVKKLKLPRDSSKDVDAVGNMTGSLTSENSRATLYPQDETAVRDKACELYEDYSSSGARDDDDSDDVDLEPSNGANEFGSLFFDHDYYKKSADPSRHEAVRRPANEAEKKTFADAAVQVQVKIPGRNLGRLVSNASVQAHVVNSKLTEEERKKKKYLTKAIAHYKKNTLRLREKIRLLKCENARFANIKRLMDDAQGGNLKALMLLEQCKAYGKKRHSWPEELMHHWFLIYYKSPALYRHFRKYYMNLPAPASLSKYVGENIEENPRGFFDNLEDDSESDEESDTGDDLNEDANSSLDENQENEPVDDSDVEENPEIEGCEFVI